MRLFVAFLVITVFRVLDKHLDDDVSKTDTNIEVSKNNAPLPSVQPGTAESISHAKLLTMQCYISSAFQGIKVCDCIT